MGQDVTADPGESGAGSRTVTRRTLLGAAAAAGTTTLLAPTAALARSAAGLPEVWSRWLGELDQRPRTLVAGHRFTLVGLQWSGAGAAHILLRAQAPTGRWSPWVDASSLGHDGDGQPPESGQFGEPVWTGPAERVQLRSDRPVSGVRLHFVRAEVPPGAEAAGGLPLATPRLDAGPGQPPIIARRAWAQGLAAPTHPPEYGTVKLAFVHHTVNPNGYSAGEVPAMLRAIFAYHVRVRGFWDIAYNFIIDAYGRIWEARAGGIDMAVIGAQAGGYNMQSTGVAMLGDFMNVVPSPAAIGALQRLVAWKLSLHGVPCSGRVTVTVEPSGAIYTPFPPGARVSLPRVAGHRDGDSTDCPGNALYDELPALRPRILALAGTPARLTIAAPAGPLAPGAQVTVSGALRSLSGAPLAGAPIELQQLAPGGPTTLATLTTAPDGTWSFALAPQRKLLVRALHRDPPASVSDWTLLAVAPVIELQLRSISPLVVGGTVAPSTPQVTLQVLRAAAPHGRPVVSRRVPVAHGRFQARLPVRRPGRYLIIGRTPGDAATVPGTSPPLAVTLP